MTSEANAITRERAESAIRRFEARRELEQVVDLLKKEGHSNEDSSQILGLPISQIQALADRPGKPVKAPIQGVPFSSPDELNPDQYINKAKAIVIAHVEENFPDVDDYTVYIIWFAKVLQNWKAILSTSIPDGRIYEVTYNGDKLEAYLDSYPKELNKVISDLPATPNIQIQGDN